MHMMHLKSSDVQLCEEEEPTIAGDLDEVLLKILQVEDDIWNNALLILQASCCFCTAFWTIFLWLLLDAGYKLIYCRSHLLEDCIRVTQKANLAHCASNKEVHVYAKARVECR